MTRIVSIPHRYAKNDGFDAFVSERDDVSIPHRYAKNEAAFDLKGRKFVSIPHRYAKNISISTICYTCRHVSIPHRYAKNFYCVDTFVVIWVVSIPHRYAKNASSSAKFSLSSCLFQFLIGTLKTGRIWGDRVRTPWVSIPHRYAKNDIENYKGIDSVVSFNSS